MALLVVGAVLEVGAVGLCEVMCEAVVLFEVGGWGRV